MYLLKIVNKMVRITKLILFLKSFRENFLKAKGTYSVNYVSVNTEKLYRKSWKIVKNSKYNV